MSGHTSPAGWIRDALGEGFRLLQAGRPLSCTTALARSSRTSAIHLAEPRRYERQLEPMRRALAGVPLEAT